MEIKTMGVQTQQLLLILVPLVVIASIMVMVALNDLRKQPATRGPKWMWAVLICIWVPLGLLAYFVMGRKEG